LNVPVDVISARRLPDTKKLADYKLVIAPALLFQEQPMVEALQAYVAGGGHLVLTVRCGMKDQYNALLPSRQPGGLGEVAGVEVEDYYALQEPVPVASDWFEGESMLWAERLALTADKNARVIARYGKSNGWLDGQIAISVNTYGQGKVYYVGAYLDETSQQLLMRQVIEAANVTALVTPPGIEVCTRVQPGGNEVYIVINHNSTECSVQMPWPSMEHLSAVSFAAKFSLPAYSVVVLTPDEKRR
jgi:beta-galactosidase